jgi:hypothetical protein
MMDSESGFAVLSEISKAFAAFKAERGRVSEADTRVKIIDRILTEVLMWPEECISREGHVHSGFIDYTLSVQGRPYVAVEAKKEGISFVLPIDAEKHRGLRIDGPLSTDKAIKDAIDQVRGYCDDGGIWT